MAAYGSEVDQVIETVKSKLKLPPSEDDQGNVQRIHRLYACSFARGARDTAVSVTSWLARCTTNPLNPSAIVEQEGHPALYSGEDEVVDEELRAPSEEVCQRGAPSSVSN